MDTSAGANSSVWQQDAVNQETSSTAKAAAGAAQTGGYRGPKGPDESSSSFDVVSGTSPAPTDEVTRQSSITISSLLQQQQQGQSSSRSSSSSWAQPPLHPVLAAQQHQQHAAGVLPHDYRASISSLGSSWQHSSMSGGGHGSSSSFSLHSIAGGWHNHGGDQRDTSQSSRGSIWAHDNSRSSLSTVGGGGSYLDSPTKSPHGQNYFGSEGLSPGISRLSISSSSRPEGLQIPFPVYEQQQMQQQAPALIGSSTSHDSQQTLGASYNSIPAYLDADSPHLEPLSSDAGAAAVTTKAASASVASSSVPGLLPASSGSTKSSSGATAAAWNPRQLQQQQIPPLEDMPPPPTQEPKRHSSSATSSSSLQAALQASASTAGGGASSNNASSSSGFGGGTSSSSSFGYHPPPGFGGGGAGSQLVEEDETERAQEFSHSYGSGGDEAPVALAAQESGSLSSHSDHHHGRSQQRPNQGNQNNSRRSNQQMNASASSIASTGTNQSSRQGSSRGRRGGGGGNKNRARQRNSRKGSKGGGTGGAGGRGSVPSNVPLRDHNKLSSSPPGNNSNSLARMALGRLVSNDTMSSSEQQGLTTTSAEVIRQLIQQPASSSAYDDGSGGGGGVTPGLRSLSAFLDGSSHHSGSYQSQISVGTGGAASATAASAPDSFPILPQHPPVVLDDFSFGNDDAYSHEDEEDDDFNFEDEEDSLGGDHSGRQGSVPGQSSSVS